MSKTPWREVLPVHPAANHFPLMSEAPLLELKADIAKQGLRDKVDLYWDRDQKPWLIDGRNRLDALAALGQELFDDAGKLRAEFQSCPPPRLYSEADVLAYIISKNIHRRHLTSQQKRALIASLIKEAPETSNLQIAKQVKVDDKTVASVRRNLEARSEIPNVEKRTDTKGRKQPVKPRGMTQKRKLGIFNRTISQLCNSCEMTEDTLNDFTPHLSAQQKGEAKRRLMDAINILQKCLAYVAQAELPPYKERAERQRRRVAAGLRRAG